MSVKATQSPVLTTTVTLTSQDMTHCLTETYAYRLKLTDFTWLQGDKMLSAQ